MSSIPAMPERIRIGVLILVTPQRPQHLITGHVGQIEVEQDDVVVVELAEIDPFFAEIGDVNVEILGLQHQFDALRGGRVVLNQ